MDKMQPMNSAPKDRAILLRLEDEYRTRVEQFAPAQWDFWDVRGSDGLFYKEGVWKIGPGQYIEADDTTLIGWYELPE